MTINILFWGISLGKVQFSELQKPLDLELGSGHTAYHRALVINLYLHTKFHWNRKNMCTEGRTDVRNFRPLLMLLGRVGWVDLKNWYSSEDTVGVKVCQICLQWEGYWLRFYIPLDIKQVISEMLFLSNHLASTEKTKSKLECGPMPNVMVALPNIGGTLCSTLQSLADAHY